MSGSTIHLLHEIPDFGTTINVKESVEVIAKRIRLAELDGWIFATWSNNKEIVIPIHLIGPFHDRSS